MPLYEYQCIQCSERVEIIQPFSNPTQPLCSRCGGEMKKLFSAPAIQFKGSGWYKTDYAAKPAASSTKSETTESTSDSKSETKSDTKTETKTETTKTETKSAE